MKTKVETVHDEIKDSEKLPVELQIDLTERNY